MATLQSDPQTEQESHASQTARRETPGPSEIFIEAGKQYAKERPEVIALWAFGIGFILGWKLKPW